MFHRNIMLSLPKVQRYQEPLKMKAVHSFKTSATVHPFMQHQMPEE